jgi:hypothetical protein
MWAQLSASLLGGVVQLGCVDDSLARRAGRPGDGLDSLLEADDVNDAAVAQAEQLPAGSLSARLAR